MENGKKSDVLNHKTKPPQITGFSTIDHFRRVQMRLTPMEYILMDCFVWLLERGKQVTDHEVYVRTGFSPKDQLAVLEYLVDKGYVYPVARADGNPDISKKWASFFQGVEEEFEEFWKKDGKNCWSGSKPVSLGLYKELRKTVTREFLLAQRNYYFQFLDEVQKGGFARSKMMGTVFLGKQERYNEPWETMAKDEKRKNKKEEDMPEAAPSITTQEDRMKKYEDTNK